MDCNLSGFSVHGILQENLLVLIKGKILVQTFHLLNVNIFFLEYPSVFKFADIVLSFLFSVFVWILC